MPFTTDIRYRTLSLPPPYSYEYILQLKLTERSVRALLDWQYTDRDELTDEEIAEEGFSADDNFHWEGTLPKVWADALQSLLNNTRWQQETDTDDSSLSMTVSKSAYEVTTGGPHNRSEWEYFLQEAVQAIYEAAQREGVLRLGYLSIPKQGESIEIHWVASFMHRRFTMKRAAGGQIQERALSWQQLRPLLQVWYVPDYFTEQAESDIPSQAGEYVDPGDGSWYRLGQAVANPGKSDALGRLRQAVQNFETFTAQIGS